MYIRIIYFKYKWFLSYTIVIHIYIDFLKYLITLFKLFFSISIQTMQNEFELTLGRAS